MPKLPIFRLRNSEPPNRPDLQYFGASLGLSGLQLGVDNLRYDVFLSPRLPADLSFHLARYIRRFGEVESLFEMEVPSAPQNNFIRTATGAAKLQKTDPADLKSLLVSIHLAILNRAKAEGNPSIDVVGRLAVIKFIRTELQAQFAKVLEQCRTKSKSLEGVRPLKMMQTQERVSYFQVHKKIILRRAGQELVRLLHEIEKETLGRTRSSLLGELPNGCYRLFLNPLILTEDGCDDYLCDEHYYMFGNFAKDPDRFDSLRELALSFLRELSYGEAFTFEDRKRADRLEVWTRMLQREDVLAHVVASYEAVPLLSEYAPKVNPQQIKNALIFREEAVRVEKIITEIRLIFSRLFSAMRRVASCRGSERSRFAARLLHDLCCYHRDRRGLETLSSGFDSINLVSDEKVRKLSSLNAMLYEFLLPEA